MLAIPLDSLPSYFLKLKELLDLSTKSTISIEPDVPSCIKHTRGTQTHKRQTHTHTCWTQTWRIGPVARHPITLCHDLVVHGPASSPTSCIQPTHAPTTHCSCHTRCLRSCASKHVMVGVGDEYKKCQLSCGMPEALCASKRVLGGIFKFVHKIDPPQAC